MKIYTRGGDTGETSLFGGERVSKSSPRVSAYGEVDELNAVLGAARAELGRAGVDYADLRRMLETIQSSLFDLGSELATPGARAQKKKSVHVVESDVTELEGWIDALETELEPLRNFILPGGSPGAAQLHLGRTVCRRAERAVISLAGRETVSALLIQYLNRLSDLLFVMARAVNRRAGVDEPQWVGRER
jgi:cob(I)alamin adenosyltransferase